MNLKEVFKNKKVLLASVAVLLVAGGAVSSKVYADNEKAKEKARIEQKQNEEKQQKIDTEKVVNELFETAIINNKDAEKVAIKNDLKSDVVKEVKQKYYVEKTNDDWQKSINNGIVNAENQIKQIDSAKKAVEKVFKDNKVVNTDQKNVDSAKKEVDKIKNTKSKKELSDKLTKVKAEIDKQNKEKEAKKKEEEKQANASNDSAKENATVKNDNAVETATNITNQQEQAVQEQQPQAQVPTDQGYTGQDTTNNWQAPAETPANNQQEQTPPPATGGGSTGGQTTTPPVTPPTQPEQPSGPPAGFIEPPFPIGSGELIDWLAESGYSGYWSSGGYIQPY